MKLKSNSSTSIAESHKKMRTLQKLHSQNIDDFVYANDAKSPHNAIHSFHNGIYHRIGCILHCKRIWSNSTIGDTAALRDSGKIVICICDRM